MNGFHNWKNLKHKGEEDGFENLRKQEWKNGITNATFPKF